MESRKRSVLKSISWRVIASLTTLALVFFATREWTIAGGVALIEVFVKMAFYYLHERIWLKIKI